MHTENEKSQKALTIQYSHLEKDDSVV